MGTTPRSSRPSARASLRRSFGYTVVEVMMALGVLTVGATGLIAMQKTTIVGNLRARTLSTASGIAATWVDRLKVDALSWRAKTAGGTTLNSTRWLKKVGEDFPTKSGDEGKWFVPAPDAALKYSALADLHGVDFTSTDKDKQAKDGAFCTHLRMTQLLPTLIRAEVRVFWLKSHGTNVSSKYAGTLNGMPLCTDDAGVVTAVGAETTRYHFVYMTTGLIRHGAPL